MDDADQRRSDAAAHDDGHAGHVHGHVPGLSERRRDLLARQQSGPIGQQYFTNRVIGPPHARSRRRAVGAVALKSDGCRPARRPAAGAEPQREARAESVNDTLTTQIATFVQSVVDAMGVTLTARIEETPEGTRINLEGEDGGVLIRRGGEGLQALQHLVATAFRKQLGDDNRIVIDCNGFRRDKDAELRQMALFMAEKARSVGPAGDGSAQSRTSGASSTWRSPKIRRSAPRASATRS